MNNPIEITCIESKREQMVGYASIENKQSIVISFRKELFTYTSSSQILL